MATTVPAMAAIDALDASVDYGRDVIVAEAAALSRLAETLDGGFATAVGLILSADGRIVVSGMGKSGHIARKIAATLASITIPALFVHPAEAAHGDMGMLAAGDLLIILSNSGTTHELLLMLRYAKSLGIPVIAIGSCTGAPLMRRADVALSLPVVEEAGPGQLAPTTSTAMMMALGDALAMAAMRLRGWSRSDFGALHPGGAIGTRLGRVTTMMHSGSRMPLVARATPMRDVIVTMTSYSFGIAGVVDEYGILVGVITDGDLRRHVDTLFAATAEQVMTCEPLTVTTSTLTEAALALMNQHAITALFVTEPGANGRPVGLVHIHDFLRPGIS